MGLSMDLFTQIVTIFFGMLIGSFLSVCIYRVPLGRSSGLDEFEDDYDDEAASKQDQQANSKHFERRVSIAYPPRSFCPHCGKQLFWWHNIPVFSWLFLMGKCYFCKTRIPFRYPLVELLTATTAFFSVQQYGITPTGAVIFIFCCSLIVISFIDIDYFIIPNVISYPGTVIGIALAIVNQFFHIFDHPIVPGAVESALGFLSGAGFLMTISYIYILVRRKHGLGLGDVKLLMMTGVLFGWQASLYTIFFGSLLGSVIGLVLIFLGGRKMSSYIPFGPYLAAATILYLFTGNFLIEVFIYLMTGGVPVHIG